VCGEQHRPLLLYVLFYKRLMLDVSARVWADMFSGNGHYIPMSLGLVDWNHPSRRFTVPESMLCKALMHDVAQVTKRVHEPMGRRLASIFNNTLDEHDAEVLGVMDGQAVWPEPNAGVVKNRGLSEARKNLLINWPSIHAALDDFGAGIGDMQALEQRMLPGQDYAPINFEFASMVIGRVLAVVPNGMFAILLPPRDVMSRVEIRIGVKALLERNYETFVSPEEDLCLAKYYDRVAGAKMADPEKHKSAINQVVTPELMACADMLMFSVAWGRTVSDSFRNALVNEHEYFATRVTWWTTHWKQMTPLLEHLWVTMTMLPDGEDSAEDGGGGHDSDSSAGRGAKR